MRKWLARLGFSFILLAAVFAWEGYRIGRGDRGPGHEGRMYACYAAAALCFGLGLRGVHERHRLLREQDDARPPRDERENR
jgi:hypothetical protein